MTLHDLTCKLIGCQLGVLENFRFSHRIFGADHVTLHGCNFPNCRATLRAATIHISSGPCKWSISQDDKRVPLWRTHNLHPPGHLHVCLHQKSPKTKATVSLWKERTVWCSVQGSCDWNKAALGCVHCLCCHGFLHYIVATWNACVHCSLEKIVFCSV